MTATFPTLPGLGWSVSKAPRFATRIQRAVSGRELRALDQPNPIWTWTLTYSMLRDQNDTRAASGPGVGYDELRTLMGFSCSSKARSSHSSSTTRPTTARMPRRSAPATAA